MLRHPLFVYPHNHLRDRQLDTIRSGLSDALNFETFSDKTGALMGQDSTEKHSTPEWKSSLPLINIKWRPSGAPNGSTVYLWNGIMATGPFITDIDNPYAFTAYNIAATKLYRPVISALLTRRNCLEIRCMSNACRNGVTRIFGPTVEEKTRLSYPIVPPTVRPRVDREGNECRFLFIGTQFEIKGGASLLTAFKRVADSCPNVRLDIITHLPETYRNAAAEIPGVTLHDATMSRQEVAERFIAQSDVLVHPTHMDSFGMVILESIAAGLPVIASDLYAIPELVEDGSNGLLIHPPVAAWDGMKPNTAYFSDPVALATTVRQTDTREFENALSNAMIALADDADLRARMGHQSRALAESRFHA